MPQRASTPTPKLHLVCPFELRESAAVLSLPTCSSVSEIMITLGLKFQLFVEQLNMEKGIWDTDRFLLR